MIVVSNATPLISVADLPETVRGTLHPRPLTLHAGEIETIELAMGLKAGLVVLDEKLARKAVEIQQVIHNESNS